MRAVIVRDPGPESRLVIEDLSPPELGRGEVRIRVAAVGVNRADLLQRRGLYPPPPGASPLLGLECAGRVLESGPDVEDVAPGDRVMALLSGGGYAEEVAVPAGQVMKVPDDLSDIEAGAFPEVFLTAYLNLFRLGGLDAGRSCLVHGGSGGVGTAAIALCTSSGARVFATAGSPERCRRCESLGAEKAFDHRSEDFVEGVRTATKGRGVDVVLDIVGAPYLEKNVGILAVDGRLVVIGLMGGRRGEIDLAALLKRRVTIVGSTLRSRSAAAKAELTSAFLARFGGDLASGRLRPIVHEVVPLDEAESAHGLLASGGVFGKVVLRV